MLDKLFNRSKNKIKFYIRDDRFGSYPAPVPAKTCIPEWYKNAQPFATNQPIIKTQSGGATITGTFKKCIPFLDAMTAGYIIRLQADVHVDITPGGGPEFTWTLVDTPVVGFHTFDQVSAIPRANALLGGCPFKWMNPWHIETPPGYSCLIVQPLNHFEDRWQILPGVVDTDQFSLQINFPMLWTAKNFKGVIEQGTPIAQVIPFKREDWGMEIVGTEPKDHQNNLKKLSSKISDAYKTFWWQKKSWN